MGRSSGVRFHTQIRKNSAAIRKQHGHFPDGPVVKNPPANTGDMVSIPGPGRFHLLWGSYTHMPRACDPQEKSLQ